GFFSSDGLREAAVRVSLAGQTRLANSSGGFAVGVGVPLTALTGLHACRVSVSPRDPWFEGASWEGEVLVVNPITMAAPVGLAAAAALKLAERRPKVGGRPSERGPPSGGGSEAAAPLREADSGALRLILNMYWEAVGVVEGALGVRMAPPTTIGEFLASASPMLGPLRGAFEVLSEAAERALYSPSLPVEMLPSARRALEELRGLRGARAS
ncbi:MAG: hypothetical protein QW701_07150, partial [Candidatus Nezhaarchaeales archaeon]